MAIFSPSLSGEVIVQPDEFELLRVEIYCNCLWVFAVGRWEMQEGAELKKMSTLTFQSPPGEEWLNE